MTTTIAMITVDTTDPRSLAEWWRRALDGEYAHEPNDEFVMVRLPSGAVLGFQKVAEPTPGKNRWHLDLEARAGEREAEVERLVALGARVVERHGEPGGFSWVVMADPDGNLFDVASASGE